MIDASTLRGFADRLNTAINAADSALDDENHDRQLILEALLAVLSPLTVDMYAAAPLCDMPECTEHLPSRRPTSGTDPDAAHDV